MFESFTVNTNIDPPPPKKNLDFFFALDISYLIILFTIYNSFIFLIKKGLKEGFLQRNTLKSIENQICYLVNLLACVHVDHL